MKIIKFSLTVITLLLMSCGSDDNGGTIAIVPIDVIPSIEIDVEAVIMLPPGADITDLVDFGQPVGTSAADYLSIVELNDTFTLRTPSGLLSGDEFLYSNVEFYNALDELVIAEDLVIGGYLEAVLPDGQSGTAIDYYDMEFIPAVKFKTIDADETSDVNWKYDIECYIRRGATDFGPYIIDPKLRIKSLN